MKVYVITMHLYNTEVVAVKSSEEKAKDFIKNLESKQHDTTWYSYEEFGVE